MRGFLRRRDSRFPASNQTRSARLSSEACSRDRATLWLAGWCGTEDQSPPDIATEPAFWDAIHSPHREAPTRRYVPCSSAMEGSALPFHRSHERRTLPSCAMPPGTCAVGGLSTPPLAIPLAMSPIRICPWGLHLKQTHPAIGAVLAIFVATFGTSASGLVQSCQCLRCSPRGS
jgi:hypothetical protein